MNDTTIKILDDNGNLMTHNVLFTFECEELGKNYIAYDSNELDKEGSHVICVASYEPESDLNKLEPVTNPEELKMINDVLSQIMED